MNKRSLVLIATLVVAMFAVQASALDFEQKSFYAQGLFSMPIGDWSDFANFGFGGGVGITVPHTTEISFRGEVSYVYYGTDADIFGADYDVSASSIPIMALVEYDLADNPFYLVGGVGIAIMSIDIEYTGNNPLGQGFSGDDSSSEFGLVAGAGYDVSPEFSLEGRFNLISDANSVSAGGIYKF